MDKPLLVLGMLNSFFFCQIRISFVSGMNYVDKTKTAAIEWVCFDFDCVGLSLKVFF